jgi:flavorubredoxin
LKIVAHTNSIRLIRHLGIRSDFYAVDEHDLKLTLKSGRVLEFLFTPFLHSPGAIVVYDRQTKSLFSGDIFGAVSKEWNLFPSGEFLSQIVAFHQIYMPSNRILKAFLERLEGYEIERILPQHGSVLEGDNVQIVIDHLKTTPCGIDIDGNMP